MSGIASPCRLPVIVVKHSSRPKMATIHAEALPPSARIKSGVQSAAALQTLASIDSVNIFPPSDFAASLDQWHKDNKPSGAINLTQTDKATARKTLPRKTSIKTPRAAGQGNHPLEKRPSAQIARVASCASPSKLYRRSKRTSPTLCREPSTDSPVSSAPLQERQPDSYTTRPSVQKQLSTTTPRSPIQRQQSRNTPRTPIQERQPPWRQESGEGKPRPCVTLSKQRKLASQSSSLPKINEQAAGTTEKRAPAADKLGDHACTAAPKACVSGIDRDPGAPSNKEASISHQGAEEETTEFNEEAVGAAAERSERPMPAEHGAAWTSKIADKVACANTAPPETSAQPEPAFIIKSVTPEDSAAKGAAGGASPAHSAVTETPRSRGWRIPWTPKGDRLVPHWGIVRSPRLSKKGVSGHIDPKALVTKRLPKIKVRYSSGEQLKAKPGRSWVFDCFHVPPTQSS